MWKRHRLTSSTMAAMINPAAAVFDLAGELFNGEHHAGEGLQRSTSPRRGTSADEHEALLRRLAVCVLCDQPQGSTVLSVCLEVLSLRQRRV